MHVATEMYVKERFKRGSTLLDAGDFSCLFVYFVVFMYLIVWNKHSP